MQNPSNQFHIATVFFSGTCIYRNTMFGSLRTQSFLLWVTIGYQTCTVHKKDVIKDYNAKTKQSEGFDKKTTKKTHQSHH